MNEIELNKFTSDELLRKCVAKGADVAAVASWPDSKRITFLGDDLEQKRSEKEVRQLVQIINKFKEEVAQIFNEYIRLEEAYLDDKLNLKLGASYLDNEIIHFDDMNVCGEGEDYFCGSTTKYYYSMPIEALWEENYIEEFKVRRYEFLVNKLKAEESKRADEELKELERLKEKYKYQ